MLTVMEGKGYVQYLPPINKDVGKHNQRKYCLFHKDKWHDTEESFALKEETERLRAKDYL